MRIVYMQFYIVKTTFIFLLIFYDPPKKQEEIRYSLKVFFVILKKNCNKIKPQKKFKSKKKTS